MVMMPQDSSSPNGREHSASQTWDGTRTRLSCRAWESHGNVTETPAQLLPNKSQCSRAEFGLERKGCLFGKPATWEDGGLRSADRLQRRGCRGGFKGRHRDVVGTGAGDASP